MQLIIFTLMLAFATTPTSVAAQRDKVNHISCVANSQKAMTDVIRVVSTLIVDVMQVDNNDWLWNNKGSCILGSEKRLYTLDPETAHQNGILGWELAGEKILMLIPSINKKSDAKNWWVMLDQIAYFPNQIVNGRNVDDQLAWRVTEIRDASQWAPPSGCVTRKFKNTLIIPVSNNDLNWWCDYFGRY